MAITSTATIDGFEFKFNSDRLIQGLSFNPLSGNIQEALKNRSEDFYKAVEKAAKIFEEFLYVSEVEELTSHIPINYRFAERLKECHFSYLERLKTAALKALEGKIADENTKLMASTILSVFDGTFVAPPLTWREQEERDKNRFERQKPRIKKELMAEGRWVCEECSSRDKLCISIRDKHLEENKYGKENIRAICRACVNRGR